MSTSVWMTTAPVQGLHPLDRNMSAEVCIIGAGIAGLSVAYELSKEGVSVIVLDDGPIGGGETERTTAHLSNAWDDGYVDLEQQHGAETARLTAESHAAAIDRIEAIVRDEKIDCSFERLDGFLFAGSTDGEEELEKEREAAHRAGLTDTEQVKKTPITSFDTGTALRFPRQAQFHPLQYLTGLATAITRNGGAIFTGSHVSRVEGGKKTIVTIDGGKTVKATHIVIATNAPIDDSFLIYTRQSAFRSYVIAAPVLKGSVHRALYWDTEDPYHYIRLSDADNGKELLILGGEDHKTGQEHDAELRFHRLEEWSRKRFPMMGDIAYRWSGQIMEPADGLAFIGHNPMSHRNVFVVTGDSGHGMTHGAIAGMLLRDLILERENPWKDVYSPSRVALKAVGELAKENANVAGKYLRWLKGGDAQNAASIAPGSGSVLQDGLKKIAVYRDEQGRVHRMSAVCPHKGCIVSWNAFEKSWDCPCHGSRFSCTGQVLNGPSIADLTRK